MALYHSNSGCCSPQTSSLVHSVEPERQSLTTTIEELANLARHIQGLAESLRLLLDSEYYHSKDSCAGNAQSPTPVPHLCENLSVIEGRLHSANANLESLIAFVGR